MPHDDRRHGGMPDLGGVGILLGTRVACLAHLWSLARISMMKTRIQSAVVPSVMLLALAVQVAAQELPVLGQGNLSCNSWAERRSGDAVDAATMIAWALGYMTAYNHYGAEPKGDVTGGQQTEELAKWIDDYCHKNPTDNFYGATAALIRKFRKIDSP